MKSQEEKNKIFLKKINWWLFIVLFIMIAGFFTWNENIVITRVIKVVTRIGMTGAIYFIYKKIINHGAVASFQIKNSLSYLFYCAYLILGFISFMWSTDVAYSSLQWIMDVESLVFSYFFIKSLLLLEEYFPNNEIRFYNLLGNTAFLIMLIFTIGGIVNPDDYYRLVEGGEDSRLGGYIMNPNELGMFCGVGVATLIFDLYRKKSKWWTIIKILVIVYALIMTKSRSSLLGLLLIVFFHIRQLKNKKIEILIYIAVALVIPIAIEKLIMRKGGIDDVLSMTGRMPFWKALITEGLPREPWFGFGFMRIDYKDYFESVHTYRAHMTHNTFIQVIMNLGFVGLGIVIFQLISTVKAILSEIKEKQLLLLGMLIPVIINSFTEFGIFGETNYGILFYQLIITYITFKINPLLSPVQKLHLITKRPDLKGLT